MALSDSINIARQAAAERARRAARRLRIKIASGFSSARTVPDRLLLAPQDLGTADPTVAVDIYSGRFFLAGRLIDVDGRDPFREAAAPLNWQRELHAFQWLRHLDASNSTVSANNGKALIADWMQTHAKPSRHVAWEAETAARRLVSWISHSVPLVENADADFYRAWLRSIGTHIRHLRFAAHEAPDGMPRLIARIALLFSAICVGGQSAGRRQAAEDLDAELARQVLPDGGHSSRNPAVIPDILAFLLPLRESMTRIGEAPSKTMLSSIDRLMAALKFYRMGDGSLARFNGVGATPADLLATVLCYDDSLGRAPENAFASGYQRLEDGGTILIADTGRPPQGELSAMAHAGTLSFEMSTGPQPLIVNCGRPQVRDDRASTAARATAAHSTMTLNDTSSSRIYTGRGPISGRIVAGPTEVQCERRDDAASRSFVARHDGYLRRFGVVHERSIRLAHSGNRVEGIDRFTGPRGHRIGGKEPLSAEIRFHLHPSVSAGRTGDGRSILLMCGNGLAWKFTCIDAAMNLEESVFFASAAGARRARQIVLECDPRETGEIRWLMERQLRTSA